MPPESDTPDPSDPPPATDGTPAAPEPDDVGLGDAGKKALDRMKAERDEARKQAKASADAEKRLKEYEDRDKTETQRAAERAETAERELATLRAEALRTRVAIATGLPPELADRLRGDDEDAMREDADRLLALVGKPRRPVGDIDQGKRGSAPAEELDPAKLAAAALAQRGY